MQSPPQKGGAQHVNPEGLQQPAGHGSPQVAPGSSSQPRSALQELPSGHSGLCSPGVYVVQARRHMPSQQFHPAGPQSIGASHCRTMQYGWCSLPQIIPITGHSEVSVQAT